jgi:hypothetical protein
LKPRLNLERTEPEHISAGKNNIREGTIYKRRNNIQREKQHTKEEIRKYTSTNKNNTKEEDNEKMVKGKEKEPEEKP